jgi:hypothetical protein
VDWVREGVEEADGNRLDGLGEQRVDRMLGVPGVEPALDPAEGVDALVDHVAEIALDERRRLRPAEVVETRHPQGADLEHVAEALCRDQTDARPLVLEDRVRGHSRAVPDLLDRLAGEPGLLEQLDQPVDDRPRVIVDAR